MLTIPAQIKIYPAVEPADMRKHFNGLWALAAQTLRADSRQGALLVFANKTRVRVNRVRLAADYLTPIYNKMRDHLLATDYIQMDDGARSAQPGEQPPVRCNDPGGNDTHHTTRFPASHSK